MTMNDVKQKIGGILADHGISGDAKTEFDELMKSLTPESKIKIVGISTATFVLGFLIGCIMF